MSAEEDACLFLSRILSENMRPPEGNELPQEEDSPLVREAKTLGAMSLDANRFMGELASGKLSCVAPRNNTILGNAKELQSVLRHLLWNVDRVAIGDFSQSVDYLGDFSKYFNMYIEQVKAREIEQQKRAELEQQKVEFRNQRLNELLQTQLEYYESLNQAINKVRSVRHDFKNHVLVLNELLENGEVIEAQEYLSQLSSQMMLTKDIFFNTANAVADAMLTDKRNKAIAKGIEVDVQLTVGDRPLKISNMDWCIILGNILDNAIEACMRLDGERHIWIEAQVRKDVFNLTVKNSALPPVVKENGLYSTTKQASGEHGIGLGNVRDVVERYDGVMQTKYEDGFFTIAIMMCGV